MTNQSRVGLPVAWLFCTGMCYRDPVQQAHYNLERLFALPSGAIMSDADVASVTFFFGERSAHLAPDVLAEAVRRLEARHPLLKGFVRVQAAA